MNVSAPSDMLAEEFVNSSQWNAGSEANHTLAEIYPLNGTCEDVFADYLVIRGGVGTTLAVFGIIGNTLSIIVLSHRNMRSPTSYFLMCLAGFDNIILMTLILEVVTLYADLYIKLAFMPFLVSLQKIGQTGTVSMTLTIATERYVGITRPFSGMTFGDSNVPIYVIVGVVCVSLIYNIPYYISFKFETYYEPAIGGTWIQPSFTKLWNSPFLKIYKFHVQLICMYILPWIAMLVLNLLIIRAIWSRRRSSSLSRWYRSNKMDKRMTLAVLAVTTLFFIAYPFMAILDDVIIPKELLVSQCHRSRSVFFFSRDLLIMLNSATNFLFYCMLGKKFRQVCLVRFCPQRARRISQGLSSRLNMLSTRFSTSMTAHKSPSPTSV
ncbi:FMRFamide receptor-like [Haliotis cracherodii]|uniref:FMRFamide receptor-like n=1 Tax=Haliotis rufescens TaxID=6454 RepID=UPI00201F8F3F|nr:FMRFamide receptor-like [Haliotis rufescens]